MRTSRHKLLRAIAMLWETGRVLISLHSKAASVLDRIQRPFAWLCGFGFVLLKCGVPREKGEMMKDPVR